jgi:hypothetical protein
MNDFLNGWGSGMTGSGNGLPSQSVLEKMGRDAAANHWNNNNNQQQSGGGYSSVGSGTGIPITTVLYEAGKNMQGKKLLRDFGIAVGLMMLSMILRLILPTSMWGFLEILSIPGWILMMWVVIRLPLYLIAKAGTVLRPEKPAIEKAE